jgi:hypothetical protein
MACLLTSGRTEPCKDAIGGVKKAFFMDYEENAFTVSAGAATAIAVGVTEVFEYELRAVENTLEEVLVSDKNTGTTVNTQTLTLRLKKQGATTANQVQLMAYARPIIVVMMNDGSYKAVGISEGMDLTESSIVSGGARADFNGYDLTFTAEEAKLAPFLDGATITALLALVSETNIVA